MKIGPNKQHNEKNYTKRKIDRASFSCFYDIWPGNGVGLFLQPRGLHWYGK